MCVYEIHQQISKIFTIKRAHLLNQKNQATSNRILLIHKKAINKHWDVSKINRDFDKVFTKPPIIAFRQNRSLRDILGEKKTVKNKKQLCQNIDQYCFWKPCNSKLNNLGVSHISIYVRNAS